MENRKASRYIGLGCGLLLLVLLIPISFAALAFGIDAIMSTRSRPGEEVQIGPDPTAERIPGATPQERGDRAGEDESETADSRGPDPFDTDLTVLYEQVNPGVVNISVQVTQQGETGIGAGSGFIIDEEGYIVTNNHVIRSANQVFVGFFNGLEARAEVIGTDPGSDLAVLKVEGIPDEAHALPLGDSDQVRVGQRVVAIGNPFTLGSTMTYGIVSAVGRVIPSGFTRFNIPKAIQTDAAINPGNSGGPLLNLQGEVIGVNAQIETGSTGVRGNIGIGFAIPSNILSQVAPVLIEKGSYDWPWLGVSGFRVSETVMEANELETQRGAYIDLILEGGPAAAAGLKGSTGEVEIDGIPVPTGGDVITHINGEQINNFDDLLTMVAFSQPGEEITLTIIRNGETIEVPVVLEARPDDMPVPDGELPPGHP